MRVWEVTSGRCIMKVEGCHGDQELTALAVDGVGGRILTGARDGAIKVPAPQPMSPSAGTRLSPGGCAGVGSSDGTVSAEAGHARSHRGDPHPAPC